MELDGTQPEVSDPEEPEVGRRPRTGKMVKGVALARKRTKLAEAQAADLQGALHQALTQLLPGVTKDLATAMEAKLDPLVRRLDSHDADLKTLHGTVTGQEERLTNLEATVRTLSEPKDGAPVPLTQAYLGSSNASTTAPSSTLGSSRSGDKWLPSYLELKGLCTFDERDTAGVDRGQATTYVGRLKEALPLDLQTAVREVHLRGRMNHQIQVDIAPAAVLEVAGQWRDLIRSGAYDLNGTRPRVVVERTPEKKIRFAAMGKALSALQKLMEGHAGCVVEPDWEEFTLTVITPTKGEGQVCHLSAAADILWDDAALTALELGFTSAQLKAANRRGRR